MSNFKYSAEKINKIIDDNGLQKVCMQGCYSDLKKLKPIIEKLYDEHIFYIDYWMYECGYHGWDWSKDSKDYNMLESQKNITEGISHKFKEIYALILAGLGEKCE